MDKTPQGNRENVYREGSDGQNHTMEQAKRLSGGFRWTKQPKRTGKCPSEGHRWTKRPKETGKMSIAKVTMDKPT
ncbi:hypothetical protein [Bacillus sp. X1(2014)]|uniref:hypothetical protein n=1 Tax=Bacillus sp. X1(2014) TaxID=1565991 RepID=UPI0011A8B356|nr:hypothetical protein [Bacillus sp. X1(2014)]